MTDGGWPYHEKNDGTWVRCASNPCSHHPDAVIADSPASADRIIHGDESVGGWCEPELTFNDIMAFSVPNEVDESHVRSLAESIRRNGWRGAPIIVDAESGNCITGSHRMAALKLLDEEDEEDLDIADMEIAYNAHDIIQDWYERNTDGDGFFPSFPYDRLREVFKGTPVERWRESIEEW